MALEDWKAFSSQKVILPEKLEEKVAAIRAQNKTIATLNGSFDLLHAGHLFMVYEAAQAGDVLIIALNSDISVKAYKGPERPLIPLPQRIEMLTALEFVDYVTWFDETDPRHVLSLIKPNVHVNGEEYGENCIESEIVKKHGGKLKLIPRLDGLATSAIIKKIKGLISPCG